MPTSIRPATPEDRPWLLVLSAAVTPDTERDRLLPPADADVRIVWRDAERVGAVHLENDGEGRLHVERLEVLPAHQGQGIGTVVLRALDEEAARAGDAVTVRLPPDHRARALFTRLGFRPVAEDADGVVLQLG